MITGAKKQQYKTLPNGVTLLPRLYKIREIFTE